MRRARRPRIHWVSPVPPARTDIAGYTGRVLRALDRHCDVVLWTDAVAWDRDLTAFADLRRYETEDPVLELGALPPGPGGPEPIFLHMGNSWVFHAGILKLARRYPAVVVLHDAAIHEAMREMVRFEVLAEADYLDMVEESYGPAARAECAALAFDAPTPHDLVRRMPMVPAVLTRAVAVLCHTEAAQAAARPLPAFRLDLPYPVGPPRGSGRAAEGPLRLVQFGHIGPNRRLESVIEALGGLLGLDWTLDLFGAIWDVPRIEAAVAGAGIEDRVTFRGFAPEEELEQALSRAHLVFNLRGPSMGEASGSQLRIWNASAASAVSDVGWYAGLPEGTAFKVPPEREVEALRELIARLDGDRALGEAVGRAGRARLEEAHDPVLYAARIAEIAQGWPDLCARSVQAASQARMAVAGTG